MSAKTILQLSPGTLDEFVKLDRARVISGETNKIVVATHLTEEKDIKAIREKFKFVFCCDEVQVDHIDAYPEMKEEFMRLVAMGEAQRQEIQRRLSGTLKATRGAVVS